MMILLAILVLSQTWYLKKEQHCTDPIIIMILLFPIYTMILIGMFLEEIGVL